MSGLVPMDRGRSLCTKPRTLTEKGKYFMAKQAPASQTRTATAPAPAPKTAAAELPGEPAAVEMPAARPKVALVPDAPPEQPKRRGRPPAAAKRSAPGREKAKATRKDILFLVETEEESGRFEAQKVATVAELLDLMDENRKVLATRQWREF